MSPPGFLHAAWRIAAKDLQLEWRSGEASTPGALLGAVVLVTFSFAFGIGTLRELGAGALVPGALWVALAFAALSGLARSFALERRHDALGALLSAPIDRGAIFVGKVLANLVQLLVLALVLVGLAELLFDLELRRCALPLSGIVLLHGLGRGEALLALLLLPASSPLLLSAVRTTGAVLEGRSAGGGSWLLLATGFDLLYLFVALAVFEFVLEE